MTHLDAGHYAAKHPAETKLNEEIAETVRKKIADDKISCAAAFRIAREFNVLPAEVGVAIDLLEVRISKCQLGLYGYTPGKRILKPAESISKELKEAIEFVVVDNRITCFLCWQIAEKLHIPKMEVSAACEKMNVKIKKCQLGAFK